jgi:hypothetical protein
MRIRLLDQRSRLVAEMIGLFFIQAVADGD